MPPTSPRLLILAPSADGYGSDRAMVSLLDELVTRFDVTLMCAAEGPMLDDARERGVDVVVSPDWALRRRYATPMGIGPAIMRVASTIRSIRKLQRDRPFDIVYVNTVASMLLPFLRAAVSAPIIVHVREVPRTSGRLNRLFFSAISRLASKVICNSTNTERFVLETRPSLSGRTVVVHDGVAERPPAQPSEVPGLQIVCVGRIHPQKGQGVLVSALELGVRDGHDWSVHFWGDNLPEHQELADRLAAQVATAGIGDRVTWHGYGADPVSLYDGMDVAVIPSTWPEGFSLVTAEAQMAGLAAIATPGGPADIIEDGVTGRIVPFEDPVALAAALVETDDPERRIAWGQAGRERARRCFTTSVAAERVAEVLAAEL